MENFLHFAVFWFLGSELFKVFSTRKIVDDPAFGGVRKDTVRDVIYQQSWFSIQWLRWHVLRWWSPLAICEIINFSAIVELCASLNLWCWEASGNAHSKFITVEILTFATVVVKISNGMILLKNGDIWNFFRYLVSPIGDQRAFESFDLEMMLSTSLVDNFYKDNYRRIFRIFVCIRNPSIRWDSAGSF